jgi:hypothetical protein
MVVSLSLAYICSIYSHHPVSLDPCLARSSNWRQLPSEGKNPELDRIGAGDFYLSLGAAIRHGDYIIIPELAYI